MEKDIDYIDFEDQKVWYDDNEMSISVDTNKTQSISYLRLNSNKVYSYSSYRFYFIPGRKERDRDGQRIHLTVFSLSNDEGTDSDTMYMWEGTLEDDLDGDVFFNDSMDEHFVPDRYDEFNPDKIKILDEDSMVSLIIDVLEDFEDHT